MVVRHVVEASKPCGGREERIRIEVSVDFDGPRCPSANAAEGIVRESVIDIAKRLFFERGE